MLCHSQRPFGMAVCLCSLAVLAPTIAQDLQPLPGRPWTAIIPDPDSFDWSRNNRPGYRYRGMEPMQQRFYDYIRQKRAAGTELTWADRAMIRRMIADRRWPEGPRPNEYWAAYMRYLRSLPNDDLNVAQTMMLTELTRFGYVALDREPSEAVKRLQEYLKTGPFEARNWFERIFGRAEDWMAPWLDYQLANHGHPLAAPSGTGVSGLLEYGDYAIEFTFSGGAIKEVYPGRVPPIYSYVGTFQPGATARLSGRVRIGYGGAGLKAWATSLPEPPEESVSDRIETALPGYPFGTQEPKWHPFEVAVKVPASGHVRLEVRLDCPRGGGYRGGIVRAYLGTPQDGTVVESETTDAAAAWARHVNETLAKLGYSDTPAGRELKRMRDALAGTDADWKRYVDEEQRRLGYDPAPEVAAYRELRDASAAGGAAWAAYIGADGGEVAGPNVLLEGPAETYQWDGTYNPERGTFKTQFMASEPGSIFSTVGLNRADVGDFALRFVDDGRLLWQIFNPRRDGPHRDPNGWHHFYTEARYERAAWHSVEASWGPAGVSLCVDGQTVLADATGLSLSGNRIFLGDFPLDNYPQLGPAALQGMVGEVRGLEYRE